MGLIITDIDGNRFNLSSLQFLSAERIFFLEFNGKVIKIPYQLQAAELYSADLFDIHLFVNAATKENDIFRVYEGELGEIIGWLFPIQALLSSEHDYATNEYFLPCAFAAFQKLLQGNSLLTKTPVFDGEQMSVLDFYDDNDVILLLGKNEIANIKDFNIQSYPPFLFKYGYRYKDKLEAAGWYVSKYYEELNKNITLQKTSPKLANNTYIYSLFTHVLDKNEVVHTFLSLYQVIEILTFDIFKDRLGKCLDGYSKLLDIDYDGFFDISEELSEIKSEKNRIVTLFSYINGVSQLHSLCNDLLTQLHGKSENNAARALYAVRNKLVHAYRLFSEEQMQSLRNIVEEFIGVVVDMLISYK